MDTARQPVSIASLAVELVQLIAYHAATRDPTRPPSTIITLLCCSSSFYHALSSDTNPHLYAQIFRATFDTSAIIRRLSPHRRTASALAHELKRRWLAIARIRSKAHLHPYFWCQRQYCPSLVKEDLMTMFILFSESDGRNAQIVLQYACVECWLDMYRTHRMIPAHTSPAMPEESEETSLWLWLTWFTLDYYKSLNETEGMRVNFNWLLTPYLMGTFKYANTHPIMPSSQPSTPSMTNATDLVTIPSMDVADARQPSTAIPGGYFPSSTSDSVIYPPLLHHAAIQLFFSRFQDRPHLGPNHPVPLSQLAASAAAHGFHPSATTLRDPTFPPSAFGGNAFTPDYMRIQYASIANSRRWDGEWGRLAGCREPTSSEKAASTTYGTYSYTPGSMTGCWEGWYRLPQPEAHARLNAALYPTTTAVRVEAPLNVIEDSSWFYDKQSWSIAEYQHWPEVQITSSPTRTPVVDVPEGTFVVQARVRFWDSSVQRWREGLSAIVGGAGPTPTFYEAVDATTPPSPLSSSPLPIIFIGKTTPNSTHQPRMTPADCTIQGSVRPSDGRITFRTFQGQAWGDWLSSGYLMGGGMGGAGWEEAGNWVGRWRAILDVAGKAPWEGVFCLRKARTTS